jgi:hypothetical protein
MTILTLTWARQPLGDLSQIPGMSLFADRPSDFGCPVGLAASWTKHATEETAMHHPAISYELTQAAMADLRHQPQRDARARSACRARCTPGRLNVNDAECQALFASSLQPSDLPGASLVAEAIRVTVQRLGTDGVAGRMAQEFGDHPEAATERMRWVRSLLSRTSRWSLSLRGRRPWKVAVKPSRAMP